MKKLFHFYRHLQNTMAGLYIYLIVQCVLFVSLAILIVIYPVLVVILMAIFFVLLAAFSLFLGIMIMRFSWKLRKVKKGFFGKFFE